jgi:hypothetical protein
MTDTTVGDDAEYQGQLALPEPDLRVCSQCGKPFTPRQHSGGSAQRFCTADCRLTFHRERQRSQRSALYAEPTTLPTAAVPPASEEAGEVEGSFVLVAHQDLIEVAWDERGNLLLRQDRYYDGDHELLINRDYFPRFLAALNVLREAIEEAMRQGEAI